MSYCINSICPCGRDQNGTLQRKQYAKAKVQWVKFILVQNTMEIRYGQIPHNSCFRANVI